MSTISEYPFILIITPRYPPSHLAGSELRARKMALWLTANSYIVEVICIEDAQPGQTDQIMRVDDTIHEGVTVHRLHISYTKGVNGFRQSYEHKDIAQYLEEFMLSKRPNIVHLISGNKVSGATLEVAQRLGVPTVVTLTDYWFICPQINLTRSNGHLCGGPYSALDCTRCLLGKSRRFRLPEELFPRFTDLAWSFFAKYAKKHFSFYKEVERRQQFLLEVLNQADAVISPTLSLQSRFVKAGMTTPLYLVRHGLMLHELGIDDAWPKSDSDLIRFGYLGRLSYTKGVDLLLEAFAKLSQEYENVSLTIWGQIEPDSQYCQELQNKGATIIRCDFRGSYEPKQLGEIFQDIDVLVMPARWPEIGPFVIFEAFAAQTPVIAARIGNIPEIVLDGRNGILFTPNSLDGLIKSMLAFIEEPELCNQFRESIPPVRSDNDEMKETLAVYKQVWECISG